MPKTKPPASDLISQDLPRPTGYVSEFPLLQRTEQDLADAERQLKAASGKASEAKKHAKANASAHTRAFYRNHDYFMKPDPPSKFGGDYIYQTPLRKNLLTSRNEAIDRREIAHAAYADTTNFPYESRSVHLRDRKRAEHDAQWGEGAYARELDRKMRSLQSTLKEKEGPRREELVRERLLELLLSGVTPTEILQYAGDNQAMRDRLIRSGLENEPGVPAPLSTLLPQYTEGYFPRVSQARVQEGLDNKQHRAEEAFAKAQKAFAQGTPDFAAAELTRDHTRREILQARLPNAMRSQRPYLEQAIDLLDERIRKNEDFLASQESPVD